MAEKRFTYSKKPHYYGNVIDNGRMLGYADVVDLLNQLSNENEQLKQQLADIDRLIYDLGHDEMRRQYEEIFKGDVE